MNTQTSIAVHNANSNAANIELISGEAVIETGSAGSRALVVTSADGRVSATDAKFSLRSDGRSVCVTCLYGGVQVAQGSVVVLLSAGQQVVYDRAGFGSVAAVDPVTVTAWQEGKLIFHAVPLRDVIAEVNRYRPGKIILTNSTLGARLFSADFRIRNVGSVIGQVERLFGATATALPGGIVLLS